MNKKSIITALLALVVFVSCSDEEEPIREQQTEQTVIFFMPWSTNMTPYCRLRDGYRWRTAEE